MALRAESEPFWSIASCTTAPATGGRVMLSRTIPLTVAPGGCRDGCCAAAGAAWAASVPPTKRAMGMRMYVSAKQSLTRPRCVDRRQSSIYLSRSLPSSLGWEKSSYGVIPFAFLEFLHANDQPARAAESPRCSEEREVAGAQVESVPPRCV